MKNRKSYYSLLLALVLCLCLTACGGSDDTIDDGGEDYSGNEVNTPDSFEGMVKDSELATNYAMYWGTWVDADNNSELIVAMADSGDGCRPRSVSGREHRGKRLCPVLAGVQR